MLPPESNHKSPWKRFFLNLSLVILLIISALFTGSYASNSKAYIRKNPALMTREISEIAGKEGAFQFRITSLTPLNHNNTPDSFEWQALLGFAPGKMEAGGREKNDGATYYRYMAPLFVEKACFAGQRQIRVTATLGVACYSPGTATAQPELSDFIKQADTAMLEAKKAGRNRVDIAAWLPFSEKYRASLIVCPNHAT